MCGIVGAVAQRNVVPILLEGLRRLEYRGYDSAGLVIINGGLQRVRSVGRVAGLAEACAAQQVHGNLGIAHTRWATHGAPSEANAHPHVSGRLAVVHNGIIENHEALRTRLKAAGFVFTSETDTEVIAHLVELYYRQSKDLLAATRTAVAELEGAYAIGVVSEDSPNRLICARKGSPLLIGLGIEENFIASDVSALLPVTQRVMYLEEGDVADIGLLAVSVYDAAGNPVDRSVHISELSADMAELGNYRHFMQKEIHEQPRALTDTLLIAVAQEHVQPEWFGFDAAAVLGKVNAVTFLACGTSYHAAKVATYWLEAIAGIPARAEIASEYRYRTSVPNPDALIVTISQSGETADTLAALNHAKALGQDKTLTICNVPESALTRASRLKFLTRAGPEIGVASTKAFTTQLAGLFLLTLVLAKLRGRLTAEQETAYLAELRSLPSKTQQVLALEPQVEAWSQRFANKHHALFLGRGVHYPIALEGALKLKEISYIHAEAYPAGELKHGPLALVDEDMPVITIAPNDQLIEKLKSNMQEVRARGGELYVFADGDVHIEESTFVHVIKLPGGSNGALSPILHTVTLQMLSYHAALQKGTDVDKPRNLAKSVTVE
ncbi:MAG: glutamine--fructose-6-phosphate transaminase (isomerizing) [Thiobacillus sp.]|jgi:glucosamine--fructose-6-phosphate aminotransferase (isomerizing)|nr:glutamine--fructose-6-phosphate transaminase (isomerizing) [Gammaproteobacteria bacterium]OYZ30032.1 MAG: glutamine--fructose-6-phosphate transaminase (isomerizing) [Hydrogenophilales bacterium 16-64-40]OZA35197.1 MAG: glutamine--fructose-6-phosphate transaminase (isomerizing) [Hydrogenophilales bacterium 17-64-65]HQT32508.1 glutamine--fructose-6-phosphate transaminase (isomerizing) [Thiobacillus sp.]